MINEKDHPVAWVLLISELDEAREHLEELAREMSQAGSIEESEFAVYLGHVYAHLNRCWHSRNLDEDIPVDQWAEYSRFPDDLEPVG